MNLKAPWKSLATHAAAVGIGAIVVGALALIGPCRAFNRFALVTGGTSAEVLPGVAKELPPVVADKKWPSVPPVPGAKPIPHREPKKKADLAKLNKKLGLNGELGKTKDVIASGKLPSGTEVYTVAPRDGTPAKQIVYEPRYHLGGRVFFSGDAAINFKGKIDSASGGLFADIIRVGRTQLSLGPGFIYDQRNGARGALLVRTSICLMKC